MPEYLAPGVFVEEVSYRSKSIEGVSTTTTGFVGPTRYGPVEIEPEVITNVTEFERVYGDGNQLNFGSDDGTLHNYLWHGVRGFFEEGGKRLYIARAFRPSIDPDNKGYVRPKDDITQDTAALTGTGEYGTDGHARLWVTKATVAVTVSERAVMELASGIQLLSGAIDVAGADCDTEAKKKIADQDDTLPLLRTLQVETILGETTAGKETGLAKALVFAESKATTAISLADVKAKVFALRGAADDASGAKGKLDKDHVIVPAARAAKTSTDKALQKLVELGHIASDIASGGAPLGSKNLADELGKKCEASTDPADPSKGGIVWQAFNLAKTNAETAATSADGIDDTLATRQNASDAAQAALGCVVELHAPMEYVKLAVKAIQTFAAEVVIKNPAVATSLTNLSDMTKELAALTADALLDAQRSAYPRAFAVATIVTMRDELQTALADLEKQTTDAVNAVLQAPGDRAGATLLRARFPGVAGNSSIRIVARLGQNVLVADPNDQSRSRARGVLPGDLVFIGQAEAPSADANKVYLAYPTSDGKDWYFSQDGKQVNAKFSLNNAAGAKLDPLKHEVCIVTCQVDLTHPNGSEQTWSGMAFQPGHTRSGAADSITDKFQPSPKNGNDARALPFVVLMDKTIKSGCQVFSMLLKSDPVDAMSKSTWPVSAIHQLAGGNDGKRPGAAEYAGRGEGPDVPKTGLKAFEDVEDISIVAAPGAMFGYMNGYKGNAQQIVSSLIGHAENMKYRIAVLESGEGQSISDVREMRARYDSKYAALYYPWVRVLDPVTRDEIHLPPSGFVAGIYARNDIDRAVYKAPANEVVRSAIGFQTLLNKAQQEVLNPEGVNCFRFFEGRGFRLWGARTISSDPEWKYVNVRRYFAYLERSIDRGTQWAVFEPNGEALWANVRETISDFLYNEWKNGALLGTDPKSAYFVRCDRSTMTQNDLDNGRLVCKIGVAALKPAEFVIFQIGQWTGDRKA